MPRFFIIAILAGLVVLISLLLALDLDIVGGMYRQKTGTGAFE
jgi:hypothetical protein